MCHVLPCPLTWAAWKSEHPRFKNFKQIHKWKYLHSPISMKNTTDWTEKFQWVLVYPYCVAPAHPSPLLTALCAAFRCRAGVWVIPLNDIEGQSHPHLCLLNEWYRSVCNWGRRENKLIPALLGLWSGLWCSVAEYVAHSVMSPGKSKLQDRIYNSVGVFPALGMWQR